MTVGTARVTVAAVGRALVVVAAVLVTMLLTACGGPSVSPAGTGGGTGAPLRVVATTTVLADLVRQVGGPHVTVESLVRKGGEVHTFDPAPSDVRRILESDLVFRNGLGLDDWLAKLVADSGSRAPVTALGENLPGVSYLEADAGSGHAANPHIWMNVGYARLYAARIADTLVAADPANAGDYHARAGAYDRVLADLDAQVRTTLGAIPAADRRVIAFHDAFPYFAAAYGLTIDGTIVNAPGQDPSAAQVARLVETIRSHGIRGIFAEAQFNDALATAIARDTGAAVVSDLYTDTLGAAPLDSYTAVMRWNLDRVRTALTGR
jgi:ABC-type Zn uptake system ZnuABC Zn-binding protein ZnuA